MDNKIIMHYQFLKNIIDYTKSFIKTSQKKKKGKSYRSNQLIFNIDFGTIKMKVR